MKNYYAILEVPVGCGVAEIRQAYRRLVQENLENEAVFADLKEAHEVLTAPARRADYDRAVWGETFAPEGEGHGPEAAGGPTLLPGASLPTGVDPLAPAGGASRCPMGAEAQCPVLLARVGTAETYCPDCGYRLASLSAAGGFETAGAAGESIRLEEPSGRSHRLRPGLNLVGRENADVLLPDKTVSRQHARVEVGGDGGIVVEDLSSTNGTQVGGETLVPHIPRTLQAGDRVRFGSVVTVLQLPAEAAPVGGRGEPEISAPFLIPAGAARAQVVETREEGGRSYPLVPGVTTFGRRAENTVVLPGDPYVSGSHAQIIAEGDVFRLTDVGSTNGTLLNGQRLAINEPVTLSPTDVILIGGTAMRFERLDVPEETVLEETVLEDTVPEDSAPAAEAEGAEPAEMPAEPRERTAPEYDVPENDVREDDVREDDVPKDENVTEHGHGQDSPTQVER